MRIQHVEIEGYRALENVTLEPEPLAVLIGSNGSGKSTVLDVFALLAEAMGEGLGKGIVSRGGFARMLTLGKTQSLRVRLGSDPVAWPEGSGKTPICYEFVLQLSGNGHVVTEERLFQDRGRPEPFYYLQRRPGHVRFFDPRTGKLAVPDRGVAQEELALARVPGTSTDAEAFRMALASTRVYAPIALDARSVLRVAQTLQPSVTFPSPTGEDLLSALYLMRSDDEPSYDQLCDYVSAGFPDFKKLELPIVAGGQVTLAWYGKHLTGPLYAHELSSGTLRFLHLAAMLLSTRLPPLLVLDEPEVSFHPELLRLLAELLIEKCPEMGAEAPGWHGARMAHSCTM